MLSLKICFFLCVVLTEFLKFLCGISQFYFLSWITLQGGHYLQEK